MSDDLTPQTPGEQPPADAAQEAPESAAPESAAPENAAPETESAPAESAPAAETTAPAAETPAPAPAPAAAAPAAAAPAAPATAPAAPDAGDAPPPAPAPERRGPAAYQESEGSGRHTRIGSGVKPGDVSYKNIPLLSRFLDRRGRILSRRKTRVTAKVQRRVAQAIKRARHLALLPYTADQTRIVRKRR